MEHSQVCFVSGAAKYDQYHAASRSPLSDTARTFAAVYVSIYPFFEGGCFFCGSCIKACLFGSLVRLNDSFCATHGAF